MEIGGEKYMDSFSSSLTVRAEGASMPSQSLLCITPMLGVIGIIFFLSQQPHLILNPVVSHQDKILHAIAYGVLAAAALFAVRFFEEVISRLSGTGLFFSGLQAKSISRSRLILTGLGVVLFCLLFGLSDELHQYFIPGRSCSIGDLLADTVGSVLVVTLWFYFRTKDDADKRQL